MAPAQEVFDSYRADPSQDPLMPSTEGAEGAAASGLASLQKWTLKEIGKRFDLKTVATTPSGVEVVRLVPRKTYGLNLRDGQIRLRCRISRTPAHSVFSP